jgi:hypothetical protein
MNHGGLGYLMPRKLHDEIASSQALVEWATPRAVAQVCLYPAWRRPQATTRAELSYGRWAELKTRTLGWIRLAARSALRPIYPCSTTRHSTGRAPPPPTGGQALGHGVIGATVVREVKGKVLEPPRLAHRHPARSQRRIRGPPIPDGTDRSF